MVRLKQAEEVKLKMSDGITLSGHLFKPNVLTNFPLIIFVTGSGGSSYEMDWQKEQFYFCRTLSSICLLEGFAFLLVDKRGVGRSKGNWKTQSFYDRADDIYDIILSMRKRPDIMDNHISVAGHSQGGWVVQLLASRYPDLLKSALSIAGPVYSVPEQILDNIESSLIIKGYIRSEKWILAVIRLSFVFYQYLSKMAKIGYLSYILDYDARNTIPDIKVPTYFAFAENDNLVPLEHNEPLARELLELVTIPFKINVVRGVNHSFAKSGKYQTWEEIKSIASPEFTKMVKDFCKWTREDCSL